MIGQIAHLGENCALLIFYLLWSSHYFKQLIGKLAILFFQQWLEIGFKMCPMHLYKLAYLCVRPAIHVALQNHQILGLIYQQQAKMQCP